jgi:hypothetical protein
VNLVFKNDALRVEWWIDLESHVEFVGFFFIQHLYMLQKTNKTTKEVSIVIMDDWVCVYQNVKDQCTFVAKGLIAELDK